MRYFEYTFKQRKCASCGELKDGNYFAWTPSMPDNRSSDCMACVSIQENKGIPTKQEAVNLLAKDGLNRVDVYKYPDFIELKRNNIHLKRKLNGQ